MNKKHYLARPAAAALSLTMLWSAVAAAPLSDIQGHWAEENITRWVEAGKLGGYEDGTFRPDNNITRAEFANILANLLSQPTETPESPFSDVKEGDWYYAAVTKLLAYGVVSEDETFRPSQNITRQDAMTMAGRAFRITSANDEVLDKFSDGDQVAAYAQASVAGFVEKSYLGGYPDGTLRPLANITRAESVKLLDSLGLVHDADSLEGIIERTYAGLEDPDVIPMVTTTPITDETAEYYLGLKDLSQVEEAVASEAAIGSIPHSVCLVRAKDGVDVEALKEEIRTSVNPRKWICVGVEREDIVMASQGNLILMVINPDIPQQIADSFMKLDLSPKLTPDANGLILYEDYYMDDIGTLRPDSVKNFAAKIENLAADQLKEAANLYYSVIPSKSYFVNDKLETSFDYDQMKSILGENVKSAQYIDLFGALQLEDYYKTDPHWRQECLQDVVDTLGKTMGFSVDLSTFTANTTIEGITGQHGQGKDGFPTETLTYLTSAAMEQVKVNNWDQTAPAAIYDVAALEGDSPYDVFLSGPTPLVTLENPNATSDKELVIFRDSYSCSLAPLLVEQYKTVTLVDLRYMMSSLLPQYVDFAGKDVLFLYNEQVVNHSEMLK